VRGKKWEIEGREIKRNDDGRGKMRIDIKRQITEGH
jgi:hypothetical protein